MAPAEADVFVEIDGSVNYHPGKEEFQDEVKNINFGDMLVAEKIFDCPADRHFFIPRVFEVAQGKKKNRNQKDALHQNPAAADMGLA